MELLKLQGLSKFYTSEQNIVVGLNNVSLDFQFGEFVAVTGESGSGKSTLAQVLGGILPYEGGEMFYRGEPTSHFDVRDWEGYRRDHISYISQSYGILPGCTVLANVVSALRLSGMEKKEARKAAEAILTRVDLWELRKRRAAKLSSGQKQRLSIARALAKPSSILLADEPTGNLDRENSEKVLALLQDAARERLVILITHDFEEARDLVTRHITLREGTVVSDILLRDLPPVQEPKVEKKEPKGVLSPYIARLQMTARPVWSGLMVVFFTLTAFAVFAFLGTFFASWDDSSTRLYDNSAFRNGERERIVVLQAENKKLTDADLNAILQIPYVEAAEPYGYCTDINYFYREDKDFRFYYTGGVRSVSFTDTALFVQTEPRFADGREFLKEGRRPQDIYEVVAAGDASLIGQTLPVYIQDRKNWAGITYLFFEAQVVGVTDQGSGLYFHEDMGAVCSSIAFANDSHCIYFPVRAEEIGEGFRCSEHRYLSTGNHPMGFVSLDFIPSGTEPDPDSMFELPCVGAHKSSSSQVYEISQENFDLLKMKGYPAQFSLRLVDYAYADRVIQALREQGYFALSPFREGSTKQDPQLAAQRLQTLKICLIALATALILQFFVLQSMYSAQKESYGILKNLGLRCHTALGSVGWQQFAFVLCGQILAWLLILLLGRLEVERITALLHYITAPHVLLLSGVHLLCSSLCTLRIMKNVKTQIYPFNAAHGDLEMEVSL